MATALEEALKKEGLTIELPKEAEVDAILNAHFTKEGDEKVKTAAKGALRILTAVKDALPKEVWAKLAEFAGYGYPAPAEKGKDDEKKDPAMPYPAPVQKEDGSWDFSPIPEAARPIVQAIWKEKLATESRIAAAEKIAKEERDARLTREFADKAASFGNLKVAKEDLGRLLKTVADKAPDAVGQLESVLKAANEQIKTSALLSEVGTGQGAGGAGGAGGDAWAKIEAGATAIVAKDGAVTRQAAIARFLDTTEGRALYAEYERERAAKAV